MTEKETQNTSPNPSPKKEGLWTKLRGLLDDMSVVEPVPLDMQGIASEALNNAQGLNKAIVQLAEQARIVAAKKNKGIFSESFDKDDRKRLHPINNWLVLLNTGEQQGKPGMDVKELPSVLLQYEEVPVNSVGISLSSSEAGVSSTIWLNNLSGLVNSGAAYSEKPQFGNGFRIDIGVDGQVSFGRESDQMSGFTEVTYTEHALTGFIEQLQSLPELNT